MATVTGGFTNLHKRKKQEDMEDPSHPVLKIQMAPPPYRQWSKMHWAKQTELKETAYLCCMEAALKANIKKIPTPVFIYPTVYKKDYHKGDATNLIVAIDKLFLDSITEPQGRKRRGLGLIPDDSPEFITLVSPVVHYKAKKNLTILTFVPFDSVPDWRIWRMKHGEEKP